MNYTFASATILLILITDPIGNIPIFANALRHVAPERRPWVILREVLIAFVLLLTFMFVGEGFLRMMNLSELSLQIGGGVILFLIALRMIFPPPSADAPEAAGEPLIVPLAALNPIDLSRILVMLKIDLAALLGYTGAVYQQFFGSLGGMFISFALLLLWISLPAWSAVRAFARKDL